MIGIGGPKPPDLDEPGGKNRLAHPKPGFGDKLKQYKQHEADETPEMEQAEHEGTAGIPPEAVNYRTEQEVCANCEYMQQDGTCSWLKFQVSPGDSCNAFGPAEADRYSQDESGEGEPDEAA